MPKLKILSGDEVLTVFSNFGFEVETQRGSHIKLLRLLSDGTRQTLTVPRHDEIDPGDAKSNLPPSLALLARG
jgi:predicted RNA binding protein YcfA (HicA-like mRNA interferase family)